MMEEQNRPYKRIMNLTTCRSAVVRLRQPGVNWHSSRRLAYYGLEAWKSILGKKKRRKETSFRIQLLLFPAKFLTCKYLC